MAVVEAEHSRAGGSRRTVLRRRDYRLLLLSFATSRLGDFLYLVALLAYVFEQTGSAAWVAAAVLSRFVPGALLSPFAGLVADRYERRSVMAVADVVQFAVMAGLTVAAVLSAPAVLVVVLSGLSASAATLNRAATSTMVASVVPEDELAAANSLLSTVDELAFVVGPAAGGLLVLIGDPAVAFGINAATFAASAALLLAVRTRSRRTAPSEPTSAWADLREGAGAFFGNRIVLVLVGCLTAGTVVYGVEMVALVLVSDELLGTGPSGYGWLLAASGVGGVLGAALSTRVARIGRPRLVIGVLTVLTGAPLASLAVIRLPWLACLVLVIEGIAILSLDILVETALQRGVSRDVLGRVGGLVLSLTALGTAAGTFLAPPLISWVGLPVALALSGLVPVGLAAGSVALLRGFDARVDQGGAALAPRVAVLDRLRLLDGVGRPALERLAAAVTEVRVPPATVVLRQGDPADDLFILVEGDLGVDHDDGSGPRPINTMTAPDYLGEIGLVEQVPRTATVTTASDALLWRIPGQDFLDAVQAGPSLSSVLTSGIGLRLARTPTVSRAPVARATPPASSSGQPRGDDGPRVASPSSTTDTEEDDMNEQPTTPRDDDVEGHVIRIGGRDAAGGYLPTAPKADESDDGEGHVRLTGGRFTADTGDVDGHGVRSGRDTAGAYQPTAPKAKEADDVEGHAYRSTRNPVGSFQPTAPRLDDTDDVSGHLSGALGSKKKTEHDA